MITRRPRRCRRLGTTAHPGGRYPWWLLHHARRHLYLDGATPDPDDDDSPLDSIVVACWTNDNRDTGYPGEIERPEDGDRRDDNTHDTRPGECHDGQG